jgi:hypothetical protein
MARKYVEEHCLLSEVEEVKRVAVKAFVRAGADESTTIDDVTWSVRWEPGLPNGNDHVVTGALDV